MGGRTAFIIDGFNVYHSLVAASKSLGLPDERGTKWLNLRGLCESYLPLLGSDATVAGIYYFSALAHYMQASTSSTEVWFRRASHCSISF